MATSGVKVLPDKEVFQKWLEEDPPPTQQQMVERIFEMTGQRVTRPAISMALRRYGFKPMKNRWSDLLPWRVREEHLHTYIPNQLRWEAARRAGWPNGKPKDEVIRTLDFWLKELDTWTNAEGERTGAVVHYEPDSVDGWFYVPREPRDYDGIPKGVQPLIRRPEDETAERLESEEKVS